MNWWKIISFILSAIFAIGALYLTKPERAGLAKFLIFIIIISIIVGIVLEIRDVQEYKKQEAKTTKWRKKTEAAYKKIDEQHSAIMEKDRKITNLEEQQKKLGQDLEEVDKKAKPNQIIFRSKKIERTESGLKVTLQFRPVKNEPLGQLVFIARLQRGTRSKILNFWPSPQGGAFLSGEKSKHIEDHGQAARLAYSLIGVGPPTIELTVSEPTSVRIEGNHDLEPFELKIE